MLHQVEWIKVKHVNDLQALESKLRTIIPYTAFTEGTRDKNDNPISFVGYRRGINGRVEATLAVWFKNDVLSHQGLNIIEKMSAKKSQT